MDKNSEKTSTKSMLGQKTQKLMVRGMAMCRVTVCRHSGGSWGSAQKNKRVAPCHCFVCELYFQAAWASPFGVVDDRAVKGDTTDGSLVLL